MVGNDWFCQRLADLTGLPVDRPKVTETTALGAAYLAGLAARAFSRTPRRSPLAGRSTAGLQPVMARIDAMPECGLEGRRRSRAAPV